MNLYKNTFSEKGLNWDEHWNELMKQEWFQKLLENREVKEWVESDKEHGLLHDPYYIRKIIDQEMHRETFITYVHGKTRLNKSG
ncbi:hypothetical protein ACFSUR_27710 [Halalkalibacter alkalisediminis]|uniref:hypothetical protein n=1 Tax=Halalkalibacter alkalisediminis TaxID=935616 RepID=UPI00363E0AD8